MKVIIYGAGKVGYSIASYLSTEEADIIVIDEDQERVAYVNETLDVQAVQGHGSYPDVLQKIGAKDADVLIAVTPCDEFNIMACQVAYSVFNVPIKIAHIRGKHYLDPAWRHIYNPDNIPVDFIISPEQEIADSIVSNFQVPGAQGIIPLESDLLDIVSLYCSESCPFLNTPLSQLRELFPALSFRILSIMRDGSLLIPGASDQIYADDEIYVAIERAQRIHFLETFGLPTNPLESVVIMGAGTVGIALAEAVQKRMPDIEIKIIEKNAQRAQEAAQRLEDVIVLHGDALDTKTLREANAESADMLVSVTDNDETNVLAALLSKSINIGYVSALVNNATYLRFLPSLGVDSILSPSDITMSHILKYVRHGNMKSLHILKGGLGEILENVVLPGSPLIGEKFRTFNIHNRCTLGGVIRKNQFIVPKSGEFIQEGDHLILLAIRDEVARVEELFKGGK